MKGSVPVDRSRSSVSYAWLSCLPQLAVDVWVINGGSDGRPQLRHPDRVFRRLRALEYLEEPDDVGPVYVEPVEFCVSDRSERSDHFFQLEQSRDSRPGIASRHRRHLDS